MEFRLPRASIEVDRQGGFSLPPKPAALAAPGRKAQAIAMMFPGLTLANVFGVPFGAAIGETFGWRDAFFP